MVATVIVTWGEEILFILNIFFFFFKRRRSFETLKPSKGLRTFTSSSTKMQNYNFVPHTHIHKHTLSSRNVPYVIVNSSRIIHDMLFWANIKVITITK